MGSEMCIRDRSGWESLLGSTRAPRGEPETAAMRFCADGYGTVSSAVIALPALDELDRKPVFRFAAWLPNATPWHNVLTSVENTVVQR